MTLRLWLIPVLFVAMAPGIRQAAAAKDELVIGVAQFPSSLHPDVDPEVVKSYVLGFTIRPLTAFGADWKNACSLCAELPSTRERVGEIRGSAGRRPRDGGDDQAEARSVLGRRRTGDHEGCRVHRPRRPRPECRVQQPRTAGTATTSVDVVDDYTAVLHLTGTRITISIAGTKCCPRTSRARSTPKSGGAGRLHQADRPTTARPRRRVSTTGRI